MVIDVTLCDICDILPEKEIFDTGRIEMIQVLEGSSFHSGPNGALE